MCILPVLLPARAFAILLSGLCQLLSLALQNVSLQLEAVPDESVEQRIGKSSTLNKLRAAAARNDACKYAVQQTTQNALKKPESRFERLTYTGQNIIINQLAASNDINNVCFQIPSFYQANNSLFVIF